MLSFSGHDREYLEENYPQFLKDNRFYAYDMTECYWEAFTIDQMKKSAMKAGFHRVACQRGLGYSKEDGTILHCEGWK